MSWNPTYQPARIFGWNEILLNWRQTGTQPYVAMTLVQNLKAACNPLNSIDYPIDHFLNYLNYEQDGMKWMLYECISHSWLWNGEHRLDYIEALLNNIDDHDSGFPDFPGSPRNYTTVREFIDSNLSIDQLEELNANLMPPLVRTPVERQLFTEPPPVVRQRAEPEASSYARFRVNVIRKGLSGNHDDMLTLEKVSEDSYTLTFADKSSKVKTVTSNMDRRSVLNAFSIALRSLQVDDDPFDSVQILHPSLPTILVKVDKLNSQTRDLIYDSIESAMDNWPLTVRYPSSVTA